MDSTVVRTSIILAIIVLAGFILRIWGLWNIDGQDEYTEVFEALRVCSGELNLDRWVKRAYLYILAFAYGVYYVIGWVLQVFDSPMDFAMKVVRDMDPLFLIGRTISAVFGTASIFVTYLICKSLFSRGVGLIAALFVCFNVIHIKLSHYAMVDATLCLAVLASFYFIACIYLDNKSTLRSYALAGLFAGIAFQTKAPAVILFIPFAIAHITRSRGEKPIRYLYSRELAFFVLLFLVGMIVGNPAIIIAPQVYIKSLLGYVAVFQSPVAAIPAGEHIAQTKHIGYIEYLIYFYKELGIPMSLLATYALIRAFVSRKGADLLLLSFMVPFFLLMGGSRYMVFPRYMIPVMPFLYILCAKYLVQTLESLRVKERWSRALFAASCIVLLIVPFQNTIEFERKVSGKNTKTLAKEWIEENIPFGSRILMDAGKSINTIGPKISENRESILRVLERNKEAVAKSETGRTRGLIDRQALVYYELLLKSVPENAYDITYTMFGMGVESLDYYVANQYQYLIISKGVKDRVHSDSFNRRHPDVSRFYKSLDTDKRIRLIKTIHPTPRNRGTTYYIYEIPSSLKAVS
jgi:hypothetical protein